MVEVEAETRRKDGVTYVWATVENTRSTHQTIEVVPRLDGPVWPPRNGQLTAPEWGDETWEDTVDPGGKRGIGFASPSEPADPPVEVASATRTDPEQPAARDEVIASLPDWEPPSSVLSDRR
jgi:hypothetical protein